MKVVRHMGKIKLWKSLAVILNSGEAGVRDLRMASIMDAVARSLTLCSVLDPTGTTTTPNAS